MKKIRHPFNMNELKGSYIIGYTEGRDENNKRLYDWLMDENREPARTKFSAGSLRNIAKEIEYKLKEAQDNSKGKKR